MMETRYYKVAGHMIGVSGEAEVFKLMTNYEPFAIQGDSTCITSLEVDVTKALGLCPLAKEGTQEPSPCYTEELRQEEEGQTIICGRTADGEPVFEYRTAGEAITKIEIINRN